MYAQQIIIVLKNIKQRFYDDFCQLDILRKHSKVTFGISGGESAKYKMFTHHYQCRTLFVQIHIEDFPLFPGSQKIKYKFVVQ